MAVLPATSSSPPGALTPSYAALKIQSNYRGWISRKEGRHVKLNQIISTLSANGLRRQPLAGAKTNLVNKINTMAANPQRYKGKSLPDLLHLRKGLFLGVLWIEMSPHGKRIDLLLVPDQPPAGKGGYQTVYKAHKVSIPLMLSHTKERLLTTSSSVLKRIPLEKNGEKKPLEIFYMDASTRDRGVDFHAKILATFQGNEEVKIPPLPRYEKPHEPPSHHRKSIADYDMEQRWYNGTLDAFANGRAIPLTMHPNSSTRTLKFIDCLNATIEIATTLKWFTRALVAHCDVKPSNILLSLHDDTIHAVLIDFDLWSCYGSYQHPNLTIKDYKVYPYWDILSKNNVITPLIDIHALLITLLSCVYPKIIKAACLEKAAHCDLSLMCLGSSPGNARLLQEIEKKLRYFTSHEKRAILKSFRLLTEVHIKVIKVFRHLATRPTLVKLLEGDVEDKRAALSDLETVLLTPEEIAHFKKGYQEIEGLDPPFLYNLKILEELESIKNELNSSQSGGCVIV